LHALCASVERWTQRPFFRRRNAPLHTQSRSAAQRAAQRGSNRQEGQRASESGFLVSGKLANVMQTSSAERPAFANSPKHLSRAGSKNQSRKSPQGPGSPQCLDCRRFGECAIAENSPQLEDNGNYMSYSQKIENHGRDRARSRWSGLNCQASARSVPVPRPKSLVPQSLTPDP